jgi:hypothetical protein
LVPIALEPLPLSPYRPWPGISEDKRVDAESDSWRATVFLYFYRDPTSTSLLPTQAEQEYLILMCIISYVRGGKKLEE